MEKIFSEILSMSVDSAWLIIAVIIIRAVLQKSPMYFRKILWGLVGIRLVVPFSFKSALSLVPEKIPQTADNVAGQVVSTVGQGVSFADIAYILWSIVGMSFLVYGIISYIRLRFRIIDGTLVKGNVYQSEKIQSPFVCGFIKPRIYVPCGLDEITQSCVLKHEETHIKYADHIIKAVGFVVLCIHWFNPLAWVSYFMLCKDIELSCDESVIKKCDDIQCKEYAKALLDLGVNKVKLSACPIAFGEVGIKTRIRNIVNYKKAGKILVCASLGLCLMVVVCFMTEPKVELKEKATTEKTVRKEVVDKNIVPETEIEATPETTEQPTTEPVTEPATETFRQNTETQKSNLVETTEGVFDDSIFEEEEDGIESDPLNRINIQEPDLIEVPGPTSIYEGVTYNNFGSNSSVIGSKPSNTVELPTVSFPADPTPQVNYHHTRPYNQFDPNQQFYMW